MDVQGLLRYEPLQALVLLLNPPQVTRYGHVQSAVLTAPLAKRRVGHHMLSAQGRYRHPDFGLLENCNDVLLGESALSHDDGVLGLRHELIAGYMGGKGHASPTENVLHLSALAGHGTMEVGKEVYAACGEGNVPVAQ